MRMQSCVLRAMVAFSVLYFSAQMWAEKPVDAPWVSNTSGPFFTGTADAEPAGSYYLEPITTRPTPRPSRAANPST